jgi:hypothetical protein
VKNIFKAGIKYKRKMEKGERKKEKEIRILSGTR